MSSTPKKDVVHAGSGSVLLTPSAAPAASRMAGSEQRQRVQKHARTRVLQETRILHEDQAAEAADEVLRNQIKALVGGSGGAAGATEAGDKGGVEARLRHLVRLDHQYSAVVRAHWTKVDINHAQEKFKFSAHEPRVSPRTRQSWTELNYFRNFGFELEFNKVLACAYRREHTDKGPADDVDEDDLDKVKHVLPTFLAMCGFGQVAKAGGVDLDGFLSSKFHDLGAPADGQANEEDAHGDCGHPECAERAAVAAAQAAAGADPNPCRAACLSRRKFEERVNSLTIKELYAIEKLISNAFGATFPHSGKITVDETNCALHPRFGHRGRGPDGKEIPVTHNVQKPDPDAIKAITAFTDTRDFVVPACIALRVEFKNKGGRGKVAAVCDWMEKQGTNANASQHGLCISDRWFAMLWWLQERADSKDMFHIMSLARKRLVIGGTNVAELLELGLRGGFHRTFQTADGLLVYISHRATTEQDEIARSAQEKNKMSLIHVITNAYTIRDPAPADVIIPEVEVAAPVLGVEMNEALRLRSADRRPFSDAVTLDLFKLRLDSLQALSDRVPADSVLRELTTKDDFVSKIAFRNTADVAQLRTREKDRQSQQRAAIRAAAEEESVGTLASSSGAGSAEQTSDSVKSTGGASGRKRKAAALTSFTKLSHFANADVSEDAIERWINAASRKTLVQIDWGVSLPASVEMAKKTARRAVYVLRHQSQIKDMITEFLAAKSDGVRDLDNLPKPDETYNKDFSRGDRFDKLPPHVRIPFQFKSRVIRLLGFYITMAVVNAWISKQTSIQKVYKPEGFTHHRSLVKFARNLALEYRKDVGGSPTGRHTKRES